MSLIHPVFNIKVPLLMIKRISTLLGLFVIAVTMLYASNINAATINAASCSQAHVQTAINEAAAGDTVAVPAGNCTWNSALNIPVGVKVIGAGIDRTVIYRSSGLSQAVSLQDNAWVEGFTFTGGYASSNKQNWVVKNVKMTASSFSDFIISGIYESEYPTGVYHGCIFHNIKIRFRGDSLKGRYWDDKIDWSQTENLVFVEGSTWTGDSSLINAIDSNYTGRYVARFNTINNSYFEAHGSRAPTARGTQFVQIYRNTFNNSAASAYHAMNQRGGTKVVFDNNCNGLANKCEYAFHTERGDPADVWYQRNPCDGNSIYDTKPHPGTGTGWMCRGAMGSGRDISLSPDLPGVLEPQEYEPAYIWNNTYEGSVGQVFVANGSSTVIIEGRDYFLDASSDPNYGKGGVSKGTWANRPICNESKKNHGYWATDMGGNWNSTEEWGGEDGALYVCDGSNNWVLYFTPPPYPHPLVQADSKGQAPGAPAAPTGLRVVE